MLAELQKISFFFDSSAIIQKNGDRRAARKRGGGGGSERRKISKKKPAEFAEGKQAGNKKEFVFFDSLMQMQGG